MLLIEKNHHIYIIYIYIYNIYIYVINLAGDSNSDRREKMRQ